jgi:hypothetical protein
MWSLTMSPALATAMAQQQTLEAVREAGRARQARLASEADPERVAARQSRPGRRPRHLLWNRGLVGRAAH